MSEKEASSLTFYTTKFSPPARFCHMVLKHLKIPCTIKEVDFPGGEHKSDALLAINPAGKLPMLKHRELCLGESRAIACYLCNKFAPDNQLYPKSPEARAKVDQLLYADIAFIGAMYGYAKPFQVFFLNQKPDYADDSDVKKALSLFEKFLGDKNYLAADHLTLADLSSINALAILDLCHYDDFSGFPRLKKWIERMKALPYYEECTGSKSKEITALYQSKMKA